MELVIGLTIFICFLLIIAREIYTLVIQIKGTIIINFKSKKLLSNKNKLKLSDAINDFLDLGIVAIENEKLVWKKEFLSSEDKIKFNDILSDRKQERKNK